MIGRNDRLPEFHRRGRTEAPIAVGCNHDRRILRDADVRLHAKAQARTGHEGHCRGGQDIVRNGQE
jgi:hypothetical protein